MRKLADLEKESEDLGFWGKIFSPPEKNPPWILRKDERSSFNPLEVDEMTMELQ